jgi:hypothetical protein
MTMLTGDWTRLHSEELYNSYSTQNIIWVIKSIRMKWAWYVAYIGETRGAYRVLAGNLKERDHLEDPGVDRRII